MAKGQGRKSSKKDRTRVTFARPEHLTPEQVAEWDRITAAQAADWFITGTEILLEAYVVSICYLRELFQRRAAMIGDPDNKPGDFIGVSESIAAETRNLVAVGRQLRLSQQSRVRADGAKERPPMPWDDVDDIEGTG